MSRYHGWASQAAIYWLFYYNDTVFFPDHIFNNLLTFQLSSEVSLHNLPHSVVLGQILAMECRILWQCMKWHFISSLLLIISRNSSWNFSSQSLDNFSMTLAKESPNQYLDSWVSQYHPWFLFHFLYRAQFSVSFAFVHFEITSSNLALFISGGPEIHVTSYVHASKPCPLPLASLPYWDGWIGRRNDTLCSNQCLPSTACGKAGSWAFGSFLYLPLRLLSQPPLGWNICGHTGASALENVWRLFWILADLRIVNPPPPPPPNVQTQFRNQGILIQILAN